MTSKNDITGDSIKTRPTSDLYRDNYDRIFRSKEKQLSENEYCDILTTEQCLENDPEA